MSNDLLSRIRIVLVGAQHPGNIGAAARAMKTMGLEQLVLVAPRAFPHPDAAAMAAGSEDLLQRARVVATLDEAVTDCRRVAGTTARRRYLSLPVRTPREWVEQAAAQDGRIALLFGRERSGLTNAELDRCQTLINIPANPDYASLNLAQAVQLLAYELRIAAGHRRAAAPREVHRPVDQAEMERFYGHLRRVLVAIGFLDPDNPRLLLRRLRLLFARAAPDANEINILRGMLTAVEGSLVRR
ncbi:MAG: RNA methyltransferase [Gammaproteobacteria bacterium]|nr:RNA methyltransferase [Gammaproteobacteria bacterium]